MFELMVEESFDAAHALRGYEGPCENLHGHTWKAQVFLQGEKLNKIGLLEDFKSIKSELKEALEEFDHKLLNDVKPFDVENPSSENLAKIIYKKMKNKTKMLSKVLVWESHTAYAAYWE
ncbi:MAG: 6-carboxytetrahydropterin synthase QueD [Candidatus Margulisiibacteriota bacterium]